MGWVRRLRGTFSGTEGDFDEERRFHVDERTDEYVRSGMSHEAARRAALERFGNTTLAKERTQDVVRDRLDVRSDAVAVMRTAAEHLEDQQIERALQGVRLLVAAQHYPRTLG